MTPYSVRYAVCNGVGRLSLLLKGYKIMKQDFWIKYDKNRWVTCDKDNALSFESSAGSGQSMKDVYGLGCFVLSVGPD